MWVRTQDKNLVNLNNMEGVFSHARWSNSANQVESYDIRATPVGTPIDAEAHHCVLLFRTVDQKELNKVMTKLKISIVNNEHYFDVVSGRNPNE